MNSKRKGYLGEHNLEKVLKEKGIQAIRIPLSGADKFQKGDIYIKDIGLVCEVKTRKKLNSIFYEVLQKNDVGFFKENYKDYFVVMKLDYFVNLIKRITKKGGIK